MQADREGNMAGLKQQIDRGDYRIDPRAVADALLRRIFLIDPHRECSKPEISFGESTKTRPLSP